LLGEPRSAAVVVPHSTHLFPCPLTGHFAPLLCSPSALGQNEQGPGSSS
jgi:hypothetical protein